MCRFREDLVGPVLARRSTSSALYRLGETARLGGETGLGREIRNCQAVLRWIELFVGERVDDCLVADLLIVK